MKSLLREIPALARAWRRLRAWRATRAATPVIEQYLANSFAPKLHLGCGGNVLPGWLNTDTFTLQTGVIHLDATHAFPFPDLTFHYILAEHMIEHITLRDARTMVAECHRVLAPGGILRISTPGLDRYLTLFRDPRSDADATAVKTVMQNWIIPGFHAAKTYPPPLGVDDDPAFVLNDLFFNYEHRFIYNQTNLDRLLLDTGFTELKHCESGISTHAALHGIETHVSLTDRRLTLTVEASFGLGTGPGDMIR